MYRTKTFIRIFDLIFLSIFMRTAAHVSDPPMLRLYISLYSIDTQEWCYDHDPWYVLEGAK
jgi:hypothetical protein